MFISSMARIVASHGAFAAVRCDGRCVTWGAEEYGGDSSQVQDSHFHTMGRASGGFLKWGYLQMDGLCGENLLKWIIEGVPLF